MRLGSAIAAPALAVASCMRALPRAMLHMTGDLAVWQPRSESVMAQPAHGLAADLAKLTATLARTAVGLSPGQLQPPWIMRDD